MDNYSFLRTYFFLLQQLMFQTLIELDYAPISYSEIDPAIFWNIALINKLLNKQQLDRINEEYKKVKRKPAVYFENSKKNEGIGKSLDTFGYKKTYEDTWMFYTYNEISKEQFNLVKKVKNENDLDIFLTTFDQCYRKMTLRIHMEN